MEEIWYIGLEDLDNCVRAVKCFRLGILNKLKENFPIISSKQELCTTFNMKNLTDVIESRRDKKNILIRNFDSVYNPLEERSLITEKEVESRYLKHKKKKLRMEKERCDQFSNSSKML
jgi:hypothetical protein